MRRKNCPNCGAPYDIDKNKCPYAKVASYISNKSLTTNISFIGISDQNGNLMTMTVE